MKNLKQCFHMHLQRFGMVRDVDSVSNFKSCLKQYYFELAFEDVLEITK